MQQKDEYRGLEQAFQEMTKGHMAGMYMNRAVKFYYITQTSAKPPTFTLFANFPEGCTSLMREVPGKQTERGLRI